MVYSYLGLSKPIEIFNQTIELANKNYKKNYPLIPSVLKKGGVYFSDVSKSASFASLNKMAVYLKPELLFEKSDIIFVFLPDSAIVNLSKSLKQRGIQNKIICHFSPNLTSEVLDFGPFNTYVSFIMPFISKTDDLKEYAQFLFYEGYGDRIDEIGFICQILGIKSIQIKDEDKITLSLVNTLMTDVLNDVRDLSYSLVESVIENKSCYLDEVLNLYKTNDNKIIHNKNTSSLNFINAISEKVISLNDEKINNLYSFFINCKLDGITDQKKSDYLKSLLNKPKNKKRGKAWNLS